MPSKAQFAKPATNKSIGSADALDVADKTSSSIASTTNITCIIVGSVFGAFAILLVVVAFYCMCRRKNNNPTPKGLVLLFLFFFDTSLMYFFAWATEL